MLDPNQAGPPDLPIGPDAGPGGPPGPMMIPHDGQDGRPAPGTGHGVPGQPDSPKVAAMVSAARDATLQAADAEKDPEDKALLHKLAAQLSAFVGSQQKLKDQASGAGPGAKMVRKAQGGGY